MDTFTETAVDGIVRGGEILREDYLDLLKRSYERLFKKEIIQQWCLVDIILIPGSDKFVTKWAKRTFPLTDEEYHEKYG